MARSSLLLGADDDAVGLEDAHLLAVDELDADAVALAGGRVEEHHVGLVDRHRLVDDAAGHALHRVRLDVLLDDVDALDDEVRRVDTAQHDAALALVAAGDHDDLVALANLVHGRLSLQNFRCQRHDLHEALGAQFARHRAEDARADRLELGVQQHGGVAVELDQRAVAAAHALGGANHHGAVDLALLDAAARRAFLDRHLDDVTDAGVAALGAAEHLDAHDRTRARVVGDVEHRLHLDHCCRFPT